MEKLIKVILTREMCEVAKEFSFKCNKTLIRILSKNENSVTYFIGNNQSIVISVGSNKRKRNYTRLDTIKNYNCYLIETTKL